ncbi:unnamed protein product [Lampetra planeri]
MSFSQITCQYIPVGSSVSAQTGGALFAGGSQCREFQMNSSAAAAAVLGLYGSPYAAQAYGAFLPYTAAELSVFSQLGSHYEIKDSPGLQHSSFPYPTAAYYSPYGGFQYTDPSRPKNATRESTATLKAWLNEHRKNPYPTKGEKIMLAIITKMTLTQVSTWFANARRRLKKENKVTWAPRSRSDEEGHSCGSDAEVDRKEDEEEEDEEDEAVGEEEAEEDDDDDDEEIDLENIDIEKCEEEEDSGDLSRDDRDGAMEADLKMREVVKGQTAPGMRTSPASCLSSEAPTASKPGSPTLPEPVGPARPKIWSLAETATSPDSPRRSPSSVTQHTCGQIGGPSAYLYSPAAAAAILSEWASPPPPPQQPPPSNSTPPSPRPSAAAAAASAAAEFPVEAGGIFGHCESASPSTMKTAFQPVHRRTHTELDASVGLPALSSA